MLASGSDVSDPYILPVFIGLFRYNVLRSGANHTECEGNRRTNGVSPAVMLLISKYYPSSPEGRGGDEVDGVR